MLGLLVIFAGTLLGGRAGAQYIPPASPPVCEGTPQQCAAAGRPSSSESDEERRQRRADYLEWRRQQKAERDAQNQAKKKAQAAAKEKADQEKEAHRQAAIDAEQRRAAAQRQGEAEAETKRQEAIEARRAQAAFDEAKPGAISGLKGADDGSPGVRGDARGLGLKGVDDPRPAWDAKIIDPEIKPHARRLASVVPPLPIPKEEGSLTFDKVTTSKIYLKGEQIYLGKERLQNAADFVVAGWEVAGVLGESMVLPAHIIMIAGKTFIAGEDGAYAHLVKNEQDYDKALAYLRNPAQSPQFARLVDDVRHGRTPPVGADPSMVRAARAITDPKLGNSGWSMAWDSMVSPEALSAMIRKGTLESATELLSNSGGKAIETISMRKELFNTVSAERAHAVEMIASQATTAEQKEQWKAVVEQSNKLIAGAYKMEKVEKTGAAAYGDLLGDATDTLADFFLGKTVAPEYGQSEKGSAHK